MAESRRETKFMIGLTIAFAVALMGGIGALIAADSGSVRAAQLASFLVPTALVLGVCLFLARILNL